MENIFVIKIILCCNATYYGKYNRTPLIRTLVIRIGLVHQLNLSRILKKKKTNLPCNCRLSDHVQYILMASRTPYQAWSKGLGAGTIHTVKSNSKT